MKKVIMLTIAAILSACSAGQVTCGTQECAAINGALMIKDIYSQKSPEKCSEMSGKSKEKCIEDTKTLKKAIKNRLEK